MESDETATITLKNQGGRDGYPGILLHLVFSLAPTCCNLLEFKIQDYRKANSCFKK